MLKAKDTIMTGKQIDAEMDRIEKLDTSYTTAEFELCKAQAEITWKARQPEIDEAYEAGMREVVESYRRENPSRYKKYETWWQDFVKRKGL